jgi:3-hydroxyisobutyrate dehydrogenase
MITDIQQQHPRLGFIGMGSMGSRMAGRLLATGYDLTIYNRARERTQPLEQLSAKVAATPAELAAGVDIIFSSVADNAAVENVMMGSDGVLAGARPGTIIIEMSTVSPEVSRWLHAAGLHKGISVLDAPVSGTTSVAEQGQLVIFVGGELSVFSRCKTILDVLSKTSHYMGPAGSGATMKLCANTLLALGMQALAEAVMLGQKGGLRLERLLEALCGSAVVSASQKSKLDNILKGVYPPAFPLRLMHKDLKLILNMAMDLSAAMPITTAAEQVYAVEFARQSAAGQDEDFSSIVRAMEQMVKV